MRNLFDQYRDPENRLSHALAVSLDEDRNLLRAFLEFVDAAPPRKAKLRVIEQTLPGDPPEFEEEAERRGLPDIVIHDDDGWCVLVESKVQARLTEDQLRRHARTLGRRGFGSIRLVTLTKAGVRTPRGIFGVTWSGLYEWLGKSVRRSEWIDRLREYLRVAEVRLAQDGYLTEGTLTMFDGFPFSEDNPYTYGEGKRLLRLALDELRRDPTLLALGVDPRVPGRPAITGRGGRAVWDFLSLRGRSTADAFTSHPHLTLAIHVDRLEAAVTIPNGVARPIRRRLADLGPDRIIEINGQILHRARQLISRGAWVESVALQRHYLSQRSRAITDAELRFRLETSQSPNASGVKRQREWVELFASLPRQKRSNIQFQYRVQLPWGMKGLDSRASLAMIVDGWSALKPLLDALGEH